MKVSSFRPQDLRNIALIGRAGAGKTTLAEAILHRAGAITRMGSVEDATTTSDYEPEARAHHHSISATMLFATHQGKRDQHDRHAGAPRASSATPSAALPAVETAVFVVDAATGVDLPTRRLYAAAGELGLARMVVVNKNRPRAGRAARSMLERLQAPASGPTSTASTCRPSGGTDVIDCFDHDAGQRRLRRRWPRSTKRCSSRASRSTTPCSNATSAARRSICRACARASSRRWPRATSYRSCSPPPAARSGSTIWCTSSSRRRQARWRARRAALRQGRRRGLLEIACDAEAPLYRPRLEGRPTIPSPASWR
jgi:GTPase SAR1 family protein